MDIKATSKPKYNIWQNTVFMLSLAWKHYKAIPFFCVGTALLTAGYSILEMLVSPVLLGLVEEAAPLSQLLGTIALFTLGLLLLSGLETYVDENSWYYRIDLRAKILCMLNRKHATTSYPNLLDPAFKAWFDKAIDHTTSNSEATEAIWVTWYKILSNFFCFMVYLFLLSGLNLWLVLLVLVTAALSCYAHKRYYDWKYRHGEEGNEDLRRLSYFSRLPRHRSYIKDLRIFGLGPWLVELWQEAYALYHGFLEKRSRKFLLMQLMELVMTFLRNGAAYAVLIVMTLQNNLPVSQFLLYFAAISGFAQWVTGILNEFNTLQKQSQDINDVRTCLEWPEPFRFEGGKPLTVNPDGRYELVLEDVSFRYEGSDHDSLSHIHLTIHPGEKLAIVGLNGAGKTTLVKLLCGFLDPTVGRVLLNGEDIRSFNRQEYYALFSAVFQNFSIMEASVAVNVSQRTEGYDEERIEQCIAQAGLMEKIASLPKGLHTPVGRLVYEDGVEFSGGETQRLMLARALYKNAPLLVLDEPTAALDPLAESAIYQQYNRMTRGRTAVFISHRLASTRFCDRILFLQEGRIAQEGTHESLLSLKGGYANLFEIQSRYYQQNAEGDPEKGGVENV